MSICVHAGRARDLITEYRLFSVDMREYTGWLIELFTAGRHSDAEREPDRN